MLSILLALLVPQSSRDLVERLRSDEVEEREEAARLLREMGRPALADLQKASRDADSEVAGRARRLVRLIYGTENFTPALLESFPGIEERATQAVISRFLFDGNLRVTHKPEEADLLLTGKLLDFYRQALRRDDGDTVEEYRLNLSSEVTLRDKAGKLLLQDKQLVGDTTYFVTGPQSKSESAAVDDLVNDFSRRVVEWVIEYW